MVANDSITFRDLFRFGWPAIAATVAWGLAIIVLDILGGAA